MKTIAALIAGLLLSLMTFVGGLLTSTVYIDAGKPHHRLERQDASALWTSEPVAVNRHRQALERVPARPAPEQKQMEAQLTVAGKVTSSQTQTGAATTEVATSSTDATADAQPLVDPVTTGAVDPLASETETTSQTEQNTAHVEWCSRHYRSYRPEDNSYRSFSGEQRTCHSPYSGAAANVKRNAASNGVQEAAQQSEGGVNGDEDQAQLEQASFEKAPGADATSSHVQACLRRYRSYRVEDNSYQPFDGGPRRQCQ